MLTLAKKIARSSLEAGPILVARKNAYDKKFAANRDLNLFKGVFPTFGAAQASIDSKFASSYDNVDSAKLYKSFCNELFPGDYPNLFWIGQTLDQCQSLFDLGGHIGVKYYSYSRYLKLSDEFRWGVHDMPAVMDEGERFAAQEDKRGILRFERSLQSAQDYDLLCAFGSLQYIDIDLANEIAGFNNRPKFVIVTIPTNQSRPTYYTVNSIGVAQCPYIIRNEQEFLESFTAIGYRLKASWRIPDKKCEIPFHDGYSLDFYSGYIFES